MFSLNILSTNVNFKEQKTFYPGKMKKTIRVRGLCEAYELLYVAWRVCKVMA
jgi:hypothetical protein